MREIIYRCWDKDNSEFAYSSDSLEEVDFRFENNNLVCYLLGWETDYLGENLPKWCKLNEKVEQYTGLTDKNGTKIFDGDIVRGDITNQEGIISFHSGMFEVKIAPSTYISLFMFAHNNSFGNVFGKSVEVIGNIHDNKELLGE